MFIRVIQALKHDDLKHDRITNINLNNIIEFWRADVDCVGARFIGEKEISWYRHTEEEFTRMIAKAQLETMTQKMVKCL